MCRETIIICVLDFPFSQNIYATLAPGESIGKDHEWSLFGAKNARFLRDSRFLPGIDISGADRCFFVFQFCAHLLSRALDFLYPCNEGCSFARSTCSKDEFINHD